MDPAAADSIRRRMPNWHMSRKRCAQRPDWLTDCPSNHSVTCDSNAAKRSAPASPAQRVKGVVINFHYWHKAGVYAGGEHVAFGGKADILYAPCNVRQ
jgi:hypothetical protein